MLWRVSAHQSQLQAASGIAMVLGLQPLPERFKRLRIDHAWPRLPAQQLQNLVCRPRAHALAGLARDACGVIQADHVFKAK